MSVRFYESVEGEQSVTSTDWTSVFSKSGTLSPVGNFIHVSAEYGVMSMNTHVAIRVLVDGVERSSDYYRATLTNQYQKFCDFGVITPGTEKVHTISIEVRALSSGQTALVRRIRVMIMQV